eukprot:TRINITY_DN3378_c0_g3_i2.p1 TRINITY_DN3378_c0_g3~~TRINITY_DN3378_c0_g3_i2.p1  ORF type:complete len:1080 (+),score=351.46 TRINITY_DN3378_c0_g3_i2:157-3396(+)
MESIFPLSPAPNLTQSFESFKEIKVLVVPVGDIPTQKFNFYLDLLNSNSIISLFEIQSIPNAVAFPNRRHMEASLKISFETELVPVQQDIDRGMDVLQSHRRIFCLVGIALCHQFPDLQQANSMFNDIASHYPSLVASKCFAFEPMQEQPDLSGGTKLIMIPDGNLVRLGSYVETHVHDLIMTTLTEIDNWMVRSPQEGAAFISTLFDGTVSDIESINKLKKRKVGRISKCKGDWSLIAGSPKDAIVHYNAAIEQTKVNNDWIWLGSAIEGLVAATLESSPGDVNIDDLAKKMNEAISYYKRRERFNLQLEATFRLVSLYISAGRKKEANDLLTDAYEATLESPLYNSIVVVSAIALCYQEINYMRKFAFYIRESAVLYYKFHKPTAAHSLLAMIAKHYQLEDLDEEYSSISSRTRSPFGEIIPFTNSNNNRKPLKDRTKRDWTYLQKIMMRNLVQTSKGLQDPLSIIRYCVFMLQKLPHVLNEPTQQHYLNDLHAAVRSVSGISHQPIQLDMIGLPLLKKLSPVSLSSHLLPVAIDTESSGDKLFIYRPTFHSGKEVQIIINWIQNEIAQVKVELSNPTSFPIEVQSMKLSVIGGQFEAYPISFIIPAHANSFEVTLSGKPLDASGTLYITGAIIQCFNLICEHPINPLGIGISLKEFDHMTKFPPKVASSGVVNKITLVSGLPLLSIHSSVTSDDASFLKLKHGERYTLLVDIDNTGCQVVDSLDLIIEETLKQSATTSLAAAPPPPPWSVYEVPEEELSFTFDSSLIQNSLPLAPGARLTLPVHVYIKTWSPAIGGKLTFSYGSKSVPNYGRRFVLTVPFHVKKGLEVLSFDIVPTCTPLLTEFVKDLNHSAYSGDNFGLGDYCLLVMDVLNPTGSNYKMDWTVIESGAHPLKGSVLQEEKSVQRLVIPIRKFRLNEAELPAMRALKGQYIKPTEKITAEQEREFRLLYWYKYELLTRVNVTWSSVISGTKGELCLFPRMFLTKELLSVLKAEIVSFQFSVFGDKSMTTNEKKENLSEKQIEGSIPPNENDNSNSEIEELFYLKLQKQKINLFYPVFEMRPIKFHIKNMCGKTIPK